MIGKTCSGWSVRRSVKQSVSQSVGQSVGRSVGRSLRPVDRSVGRSVGRSRRPVSHSVSQSISLSVSQLVKVQVSQLACPAFGPIQSTACHRGHGGGCAGWRSMLTCNEGPYSSMAYMYMYIYMTEEKDYVQALGKWHWQEECA